jgi:ankyrin repeat protein
MAIDYFEFAGALGEQNCPKVQEFLSRGIDLRLMPGITSLYPLHLVALEGDCDLMALLLHEEANKDLINQFDDLSNTPLMEAVAHGQYLLAKFLLDQGADVNACEQERAGNNAIKIAVETGNLEMTNLLMDHGADPRVPGWMNVCAVDRAERNVKAHRTNAEAILKRLSSKHAG